ncbi:MAG: hypothetical protein CBD18_09015 [Opitutales bacterium TMED158]|nr:MAG: hypothetical protein CBD18_09015 [Opitutales bacterium TMED158]
MEDGERVDGRGANGDSAHKAVQLEGSGKRINGKAQTVARKQKWMDLALVADLAVGPEYIVPNRLAPIMNLRIVTLIALCATPFSALNAGSGAAWTEVAAADKTLMGDYVGEWVNPEEGYQAINPSLCAQVINVDKGKYHLKFTQDHNLRAEIYFSGDAVLKGDAIVAKQGGWDIRVTQDGMTGKGRIGDNVESFSLKRVSLGSPTLGQKPPKGSIVLFDGSSMDEWEHDDGRACTWTLLENGAMEINPRKENQGADPKIGGDIRTKRKFRAVRYHMEFRYPVEPGKSGQGRGNSGLFFHGYEAQILNSYGLTGLWNELGALYKLSPPQVNMARPPMEWQTYDIVFTPAVYEGGKLQENPKMTVRLNGVVVQKNVELRHQTAHRQADRAEMPPKTPQSISLQDHSNRIQFRNIWVKEL